MYFPFLSAEDAELLLERGVNALGIDTLSPDRPEDGFKVHKAFLGADKIIILVHDKKVNIELIA